MIIDFGYCTVNHSQ